MEDKRRFERIFLDGEAQLAIAGDVLPVRLVDISLKGALLDCAQIPQALPGADCLLTLILEDSDIRIPVEARISHQEPGRTGLEFVRVDVDDMQHLRRLVELHAGDRSGELHHLFRNGGNGNGEPEDNTSG